MAAKVCAWQGCERKAYASSTDPVPLCLEHIRERNRDWDAGRSCDYGTSEEAEVIPMVRVHYSPDAIAELEACRARHCACGGFHGVLVVQPQASRDRLANLVAATRANPTSVAGWRLEVDA